MVKNVETDINKKVTWEDLQNNETNSLVPTISIFNKLKKTPNINNEDNNSIQINISETFETNKVDIYKEVLSLQKSQDEINKKLDNLYKLLSNNFS